MVGRHDRESSTGRLSVLDGLRGIAIVAVVLSHGWQLWPTDWIDDQSWLRPVFRSGNFAVTIFLVAAGFLTWSALSRRGLENIRPGVALVRRVLRVGPSLWLMLLVLSVVSAIDTTDESVRFDNTASFAHVLTYTWNWYVQGNLTTSRPDFGHLWYLSVDMQAFLLLAVLLYLLRRRPLTIIWTLVGLLLVLTWWRFHVADTEFVFQVLVRTSARMDPFVVGLLAAALVPRFRALNPAPVALRAVAGGSAALLVPLAWYCANDSRFLGWGVTAAELTIAALFCAVALGARAPAVLGLGALTLLGRNSLLIYIWHYPVFVFVNRHSTDWSWQLRTVAALALTLAVCLVAHWTVERRAVRLLQHPGWRTFDDGAVTGLLRVAGLGGGRDASGRGSGADGEVTTRVERDPHAGHLRGGGHKHQ